MLGLAGGLGRAWGFALGLHLGETEGLWSVLEGVWESRDVQGCGSPGMSRDVGVLAGPGILGEGPSPTPQSPIGQSLQPLFKKVIKLVSLVV